MLKINLRQGEYAQRYITFYNRISHIVFDFVVKFIEYFILILTGCSQNFNEKLCNISLTHSCTQH